MLSNKKAPKWKWKCEHRHKNTHTKTKAKTEYLIIYSNRSSIMLYIRRKSNLSDKYYLTRIYSNCEIDFDSRIFILQWEKHASYAKQNPSYDEIQEKCVLMAFKASKMSGYANTFNFVSSVFSNFWRKSYMQIHISKHMCQEKIQTTNSCRFMIHFNSIEYSKS